MTCATLVNRGPFWQTCKDNTCNIVQCVDMPRVPRLELPNVVLLRGKRGSASMGRCCGNAKLIPSGGMLLHLEAARKRSGMWRAGVHGPVLANPCTNGCKLNWLVDIISVGSMPTNHVDGWFPTKSHRQIIKHGSPMHVDRTGSRNQELKLTASKQSSTYA